MAEMHVSAADLKVADLKKELEKRGLSKSGNKAQLIERLEKGLEKEGETLDSIFGAQVCAQTSSAISGSDMARWGSQMVKKDSNATTTTPSADGATSPVVSPTPPAEHTTPQITPQPQLPVEPSAVIQTPPQLVNNGCAQMPIEVAQVQPPMPSSEPLEVFQQVEQPVEIEPPQPQVPVEPAAMEVQNEPEQPVTAAVAEPAPEPVPDLITSQPAYSEPLLLESEARGAFSSPLSVQEQDRLSDDEHEERPANKMAEEKKQEEQVPEPPRSVVDPAMLVPRRQLRQSEKRPAETGAEGTGEAKRKRKWSEEVTIQSTPTKNAIISTESLKLMNLPVVSDIEEEKQHSANRDDRTGPRRRRFVAGEGETVEAKEPAAEPQRLESGTEEGEMMDTLELTIEEKGDDLGGDDLGSGGESAKKAPKPAPSQPTVTLNRKNSSATSAPVPLEVDEPRRTKRTVSPARSEPTNILHVENLVRPFSLGQLKELLSRVGTVDETMFWTDKVKSHCIVGYKAVEDAVKTREALHGTQWPSTNPKILSVDFVTQEFLEKYKKGEEGSTRLTSANIVGVGIAFGGAARPPRLVKGSETIEKVAVVEKNTEERSFRRSKGVVNGNMPDASTMRRLVKTVDNSSHREAESGAPLRDRQVAASNNEVKHKEHRRKHSESRQQQPAAEQQEQPAEPPKPRVSLDDLFRRTKTLPHLYWLPLTEDDVVRRDNERKEREKEREAREREREKEREQREKEREMEREQREKERARERERELEKEREREQQQRERERDNRSRDRQDRERQPDRRDYSDSRQRRPSPVEQARGRRPSPEPPRRQPALAAPPTFRVPVTPPPFRGADKTRSRSRSASHSASRSSASRSRSSSSASSAASSRSRSSSADSRDRRGGRYRR